jgi:hypothetical protein
MFGVILPGVRSESKGIEGIVKGRALRRQEEKSRR